MSRVEQTGTSGGRSAWGRELGEAARRSIRKIESILDRSHEWAHWSDALEGAMALEQRLPDRVERFFCVDTSEVVQYLSPGYLLRSGGEPASLDYAVSLLFRHSNPLFILPLHAEELAGVLRGWQEQLEEATEKLRLLRASLETVRRTLDGVEPEEVSRQIVDLVLSRKAAIFGSWFGPADGYERRRQEVENRLRPLRAVDVALGDWRYQHDAGRVDDLFKALTESQIGRGGPHTDLVDAHCLHLLEQLNQELGDDKLVILLTRSGKIREVVSQDVRDHPQRPTFCRAFETDATTVKVSLVQPPQLVLAQEMLRTGGADNTKELERMAADLARQDGLRDLRYRLQHECIPLLRADEIPDDLESLLERLSLEIDQLETQYESWVALEHFKQSVSLLDRGGSSDLPRFREAIERADRPTLEQVLRERLDPLILAMEELESSISMHFTPVPRSTALSFEAMAKVPSHGLRAILRSQPGGMVVFAPEFQSRTVQERIERLRCLLEQMDAAADAAAKDRAEDELRAELYACELTLSTEPEYYLLLSFIYSSRDMWFQAYEAATKGRKEVLRDRQLLTVDGDLEPALRAAVCELLLAEGTALRMWSLEHCWDLKLVAAGLMRKAADLCHWSLKWNDGVPTTGDDRRRRARCLREVSVIFGACHEAGIPVQPSELELEDAGVEDTAEILRLVLFRHFAHRALDSSTEADPDWKYYLNGYLYALTISDLEDELEERQRVARRFEGAHPESDPILLDTLAWHYYKLAQRRRSEKGEWAPYARLARERIDEAVRLARDRAGYYGRFIHDHQAAIHELSEAA